MGSLSISLSAYVRVPLSTTGAVVMSRMPKIWDIFVSKIGLNTNLIWVFINYSKKIGKKMGKKCCVTLLLWVPKTQVLVTCLILSLTNTWLTSSRWGGRICLKCSITKWHNFYDVEYLAGPYDNVEEKRWLLHWWHYFHSRQTHIWKKCKQLEYIYILCKSRPSKLWSRIQII